MDGTHGDRDRWIILRELFVLGDEFFVHWGVKRRGPIEAAIPTHRRLFLGNEQVVLKKPSGGSHLHFLAQT
jgi:hypothetical protein